MTKRILDYVACCLYGRICLAAERFAPALTHDIVMTVTNQVIAVKFNFDSRARAVYNISFGGFRGPS